MPQKLTGVLTVPVFPITRSPSANVRAKACLQNNGVTQAQFVETCNSLAKATTALGGPPAKVILMASRPVPAQASCTGFFGQPMTSYYYKRDAKTLASSRAGCQAHGGKWQ
jgi:hypothetical protein